MEITEFGPEHVDAVQAFLGRIESGESAFFKEDISSPDAASQWLENRNGTLRYVAVDGSDVLGYTAVIPGAGWSSHVGEVRLVVDPTRRRGGVGKLLARRALVAALEADLRKLVVEVVADQQPAITLFTNLGFTPEAVLADQVRDRNGTYHDLMVLAHDVEDVRSTMATVGITDELT
jgi:L-amino acid N-acyltransferase YncA